MSCLSHVLDMLALSARWWGEGRPKCRQMSFHEDCDKIGGTGLPVLAVADGSSRESFFLCQRSPSTPVAVTCPACAASPALAHGEVGGLDVRDVHILDGTP
mmetsp:Transcript_100604/g.252214  ORF Transcript_100604/g.252214 Transcript_100604/m.252214 type:complete len:101 (-) Transcript_100604:115-417(-)